MSMNPRARFIRIVLAAAVGSLVWAGCATETIIVDPAGAQVSAGTTRMTTAFAPVRDLEQRARIPVYLSDIAAAPVDLTKRRPDTHPELRGGLWQMSTRGENSYPGVAESPVAEIPDAPRVVDSTSLLTFNPEVINVAAMTPEPSPGGIIVEAAGAEPGPPPALQKPASWWDLWYRKRPQEAPRRVIEVQPSAPVESAPVAPAPEAPVPSTYFQNSESPDGGPLLRLHMVQR